MSPVWMLLLGALIFLAFCIEAHGYIDGYNDGVRDADEWHLFI